MDSQVVISIIIPTLNRKDSLKQTLLSLQNQNFLSSKYEIIICDDIKSKDGTEELVKEYIKSHDLNIKYFKIKPNLPGPAAARNFGVNKAEGKIIGFIDDDCIAFPDWISTAMEIYENQNVDIIQGMVLPRYPEFKWSNLLKIPRGVIHTQDNGFYVTANLFVSKEIFIDVGGFEETLKWGEDTDLVYRLLKKGHNIFFSKSTRIYHEMEYINIIAYCRYLKNYSYLPLQVKRNPEMKNSLFLKIFSSKNSIYPLLAFVSLLFYVAGSEMLSIVSIVLSIIFYGYSRVFTDFRIHKIILRVIFFPRNFIIDSVRLFYLLKGSIKHKVLVL